MLANVTTGLTFFLSYSSIPRIGQGTALPITEASYIVFVTTKVLCHSPVQEVRINAERAKINFSRSLLDFVRAKLRVNDRPNNVITLHCDSNQQTSRPPKFECLLFVE